MSIAPDRIVGASSVGAAPARDPVFMPLLRRLAVLVAGFYRHGAPTALGNLRRRQGVFQQAVRRFVRYGDANNLALDYVHDGVNGDALILRLPAIVDDERKAAEDVTPNLGRFDDTPAPRSGD